MAEIYWLLRMSAKTTLRYSVSVVYKAYVDYKSSQQNLRPDDQTDGKANLFSLVG